MKTVYYVASSLDGYIAGPDHSLGWLLQFGDMAGDSYEAFIRDVGAIAMGSATYEWILRHLDDGDEAGVHGWPYAIPAWVFTTRSLPEVPGADVHFVRGNVRTVHQKIAQATGDGTLWVAGGGILAGQFHDERLLDELVVQVAPVTLGGGSPILPRPITSPPLALAAVERYGDFVELRYRTSRPTDKVESSIVDPP